jgi:hypothetical protein
MNKHLSEEELLALVSGEQSDANSFHVAACAKCRQEVEQLSGVLGGFRASTRDWAEQKRQEVAVRPPVRNGAWSGQALRLATALAMLLLVFGVFLVRHKEQPAPTMATVTTTDSDDAVLERLDAAMSRSVPSAMEPLSALVPTENQEKSGGAN